MMPFSPGSGRLEKVKVEPEKWKFILSLLTFNCEKWKLKVKSKIKKIRDEESYTC